MAEPKDVYTKLKLAVMGTRTQKIDAKLDQAVKDIATYRSNSGRNGYIDLVKSLISKTAGVKISSSSGLFSQGGAGPSSFGQGGRVLRYKTYQAIISNINYCHRALQVLVDNILSPDDITKVSLDIKPKENTGDTEEVSEEGQLRRVKNVIRKIKLEEDLNSIVKNTLLFGDFFCEIGDAITALTSKSLLSEAEYIAAVETSRKRGDIETFTETINRKKYTFSINYSALNEDKQADEELKNIKKLKNLKLIYHEPQFVLRLQSSLFPVCFGYLIFPQITVVPGTSIAEDAINNIVLSILKSLEKKIPQMKEFKNNDDLKHIIAQMLAQSDYNKAVEVRYVAPDKMVHFNIPSTKYYPYGESIFDNGQYSAKVLIALETALAIQRLARSTEKRKIAVEVGLPRDAKKVIEKLKEEFRKRKITLDSFGTVDTIPCLDLNTQIRMTNGFAMTLEDIIYQFENGNRNLFVYSYNFETGKIIPNKITNAKISGKNIEVVKVILDNGKEVKCTKEHRWLMRDGTYKEAQNLKPGDSLMPFYRRTTNYSNNKLVPYEEIYHPGKKDISGKWELTHRAFSNFLEITNTEKNVCHHKDRNPMNNHPDNYQGVTFSEHMIIHNKECIESRGKDKIIVDCICPYCGEEYQSYYAPRSSTCGKKECITQAKILGGKASWKQRKHQNKYDIITTTCEWCGKDFKISRAILERKQELGSGILCGDMRCVVPYRTLKRTNKPFCEIEFIHCEICNKLTVFSNDKKSLRTCSNLCTQTLLSRRRWKSNRVSYKCDWCGDIFEVPSKKIKEDRYNSCSKVNCKNNISKLNKFLGMSKERSCNINYTSCVYCSRVFIQSDSPSFIDRHVARSKGYCDIKCWNSINRKKAVNHKVVSIEFDNKKIDVGDIEVEKFHNFGLQAGVFIHNSMITTFEDVYIPQRDGKPFVDISTFNEGNVDVRSKVDELKFIRDQLVAGLGVPPGFIGIDENITAKNTLTEENILFARTIIAHQKYLTHQVQELLGKIFDVISPEEALTIFDDVQVSFPPPKSLQYEREARYMNEVTGLIDGLERVGIPKEYSRKKYLPQIDWDEVSKYETDVKIDQTLDPSKKEDEMDMGGMGGMGGAPY